MGKNTQQRQEFIIDNLRVEEDVIDAEDTAADTEAKDNKLRKSIIAMANEDDAIDDNGLNDENEEQNEDSLDAESTDDASNPFSERTLDDNIIPVSGLYENWFLDYASYVILERAVPSLYDGFKPVQRSILHSMKEMDDGRYNKVANIIGNTMKYHPHGDASIGDALVQLGQKDLLIDCQGNWGNTLDRRWCGGSALY